MSFRQSNKAPETTWLKQHREALLQSGMPASVVDDERRWKYVLLHGVDEFGSGWDPSWLSQAQAETLLTVLQAHYTNPSGIDLIAALKKRRDEPPKA